MHFDTGELRGFISVARKLLGIERAAVEEDLHEMKESIKALQTDMEKVLMSQTQTQTDVAQMKQDQSDLLGAVNNWRSRVQAELDVLKTQVTQAQADAEAAKNAAASASNVPPELQAAIDQNHNGVQQIVQQLNALDTAVASSPPAPNTGLPTGTVTEL